MRQATRANRKSVFHAASKDRTPRSRYSLEPFVPTKLFRDAYNIIVVCLARLRLIEDSMNRRGTTRGRIEIRRSWNGNMVWRNRSCPLTLQYKSGRLQAAIKYFDEMSAGQVLMFSFVISRLARKIAASFGGSWMNHWTRNPCPMEISRIKCGRKRPERIQRAL